MRAIALLLLLTLMGASAQFQPVDPDWGGYEEREDIATAGDLEGARRVLRFVQVSDAHIIDDDAPAPMRVDALDAVFFGTGVSDGARRPQEEYTDEALDAMIRAINEIHGVDPFDFVLNTGDNIDNDLENELMRFIDNWEGTLTTVGPVSSLPCQPDGQSLDAEDDTNDVTEACTYLPASVSSNNTPLATGLPWFSAFGNHDGLIQGNVPIEPSFNELANEFGRRFLTQSEFVGMHFAAGGACVSGKPAGQLDDDFGHGYGFAGDRLCDADPDNDGYYAFGSRGVRFIVLDTVNDNFVTGNANYAGGFDPERTLANDIVGGYSEGSIDGAQFEWMLAELERSKDEVVILMSHHTVNSMFTKRAEGQCGGPNGECLDDLLTAAGYKTGKEILEALAAYPHVISWLGGHTHQHRIEPKSVAGAASAGFWNIETSSVIDMPQEARIVELWVTADGGKGFLSLLPFTHDYVKSRDLALTDDQFDATVAAGTSKDRQVILWFDVPPAVQLVPQSSIPRVMRVDTLGPERVNGTHGHVDEPLTAALRVTDQVAGTPLEGLHVTVEVEHMDPSGETAFLRVLNATLDDAGNGTYSFAFTPQAAYVHYLSYTVTDPLGAYPAVDRIVSLDIAGDPVVPTTGKKSPGLALAGLVIVLAAIVAVRRP